MFSLKKNAEKRYLELHAGQLVHDVAHGLPDDVPGDLVLGLRGGLHTVPGQVVERDHVTEHTNGLVERTVSKQNITLNTFRIVA